MVQTNKSTGIFMLIDGGHYTFNFTEARAACLFLNVTIATKAQMEEAVQHGLETCKFGWVAEKTAVIPRIKSDNNCGKGKTGLVLWNASADRKFAVFCFNASAAHIALISLSVVLLLLTAATAWWCYRKNTIRRCVRHHKDDTETEMWRNTHSEMDLHSEDGAEIEHDEEQSTKYSSEITLCVNPGTETNPSE
ncbi:lymphatic vessel endothelial hyaluronic receptor 1b [Anableps anableps]